MKQHDLVVIGAGPGGYVAAIRAAQLGMDVACIELEPKLGGTCLRVGCIPSKALLESSQIYSEAQNRFADMGIQCESVKLDLAQMQEQKERVVATLTTGVASLLKKNKVTRYSGRGSVNGTGRVVVEGEDDQFEIETKYIVLATGSQPATLPDIEFDGDRVGSSTDALAYNEVPKHLVVIGAGYIGLEMGIVWHRLGSKVTVLEYLDRILPGTDSEIAAEAKKAFEKQGIEFQLGCQVTSVQKTKKRCEVHRAEGEPVKCDKVLVAVGRKPNTSGLGLDSVNVATDERGFISVDKNFQTSSPNIFAIGDVIGGAMLAHKAEEEAIACVEQIANGYGHLNYDAIPSVVYTYPEIASVGKTEDQLKEDQVEYRRGVFPFTANGRARAIGHTEGHVKVLADAKTDRLLGVHIIGPHAGDLIAEAAVAIEFGASSEDLARCCHAHPTLAEAVKEASLATDGRAIHC